MSEQFWAGADESVWNSKKKKGKRLAQAAGGAIIEEARRGGKKVFWVRGWDRPCSIYICAYKANPSPQPLHHLAFLKDNNHSLPSAISSLLSRTCELTSLCTTLDTSQSFCPDSQAPWRRHPCPPTTPILPRIHAITPSLQAFYSGTQFACDTLERISVLSLPNFQNYLYPRQSSPDSVQISSSILPIHPRHTFIFPCLD